MVVSRLHYDSVGRGICGQNVPRSTRPTFQQLGKNMTVKELLKAIQDVGANPDDDVRMGSDAERFAHVTAIGLDNDTGTLIIYTD